MPRMRTAQALLVAGLTVAGLVTVAAPATAAGNLECSLVPPVGTRCDLNAAGQASTFTSVVWHYLGTTRTATSIYVMCPYGTGYNEIDMEATFVDASGQPQDESGTFACIRSK